MTLKMAVLSSLFIGETIFGASSAISYPASSMAGWSFEDSIVSSTVYNDPAVSVVEEPQAQEIFKKLASKMYIPFSYTKDGCEARAHEMAMVADRWNVTLGKMFLVGSLINGWQYHVAPFLLVKTEGGLVPYILDPSVDKKAVPFYTWIKEIVGFNFSYHSLFVTSRYIYRSSDREQNLQSYKTKDYVKTGVALIYFNLLNAGQ